MPSLKPPARLNDGTDARTGPRPRVAVVPPRCTAGVPRHSPDAGLRGLSPAVSDFSQGGFTFSLIFPDHELCRCPTRAKLVTTNLFFRYAGSCQDPSIRMSQSEGLGISLGISHCAPSSFLIEAVFHLLTSYYFCIFDRLNPWWADTHRHNADPVSCSDYCSCPGSLDGCLGLPDPGRQLGVSTDFGEAHPAQDHDPGLT